jgi:tetratricopeptide (TPR) repeat protein
LKLYNSASAIDAEYAELEFRIARSLRALGDNAKAKEHFVRARDLDTLRFRADSKINDINRSVALSSQGVELVDADSLFSAAAREGITNSDLIYEHVHLTPRGNYVLAQALFADIAKQLPVAPGDAVKVPDAPSEADCERWLAFTKHDHARISAEMLRRLQQPPFTNQINHSEQLLRMMAKNEDKTEMPEDTALQYQSAIARKPDDRILHFNYGVFLTPYNPAAAEQELSAARAFDGFPVVTPDGQVH